MSQTKTPILLIGFNRPDTMQKVFDEVRKARPFKLYYAVDGARSDKDGEEEKVNLVQAIIQQVDWPCEVHTLFRTSNRGCGYGPAEAITWAFEQEESLIVLEDDCVPNQSFFRFCDEMIDMYVNDTRVNIVSGRSHHRGFKAFANQDYIFTHYAHTWGWATWKRVWREFDIKMSDFPSFIREGGALNVFSSKEEGIYYNKLFGKIYNQIDDECTHSWDSQWVYTRMKMGGLGIVPAYNLIRNIGEVGTHSTGHQPCFDLEAEEMPFSIRHPKFVTFNREYEEFHFKTHIKMSVPLWKKVINRVMRLL